MRTWWRAYDDPAALQRMTLDCDVVTTEFENPPAGALDHLAERVRVAPSPASVRIAQDRIAEKRFLVDNGFTVGPYLVLDDPETVTDPGVVAPVVDGGAIVKTARLGYDGKGQRRVTDAAAMHARVGRTRWRRLRGRAAARLRYSS